MKHVLHIASFAAIALFATSASAQFVKGNEAVSTAADGVRKVETPPLPAGKQWQLCLATNPACVASAWSMVETSDGLSECTEIYARAGTCRKSTYGSEKKSRLWIVKTRGQWMQCQHPDLSSKCVRVGELPYSAVQ